MKKEIIVRRLNEKENFFDNKVIDADFNDNLKVSKKNEKGVLFRLKEKFLKSIKYKNDDITKKFKNNKANCMNNIEALKIMMLCYSLRKIDSKIRKINVFNSGVFQTLLGLCLVCCSIIGFSYLLTDEKIILYALSFISLLLIVFQSTRNIAGLLKFKKHLLSGTLLYIKKSPNKKNTIF